jgi:hypothetical protein
MGTRTRVRAALIAAATLAAPAAATAQTAPGALVVVGSKTTAASTTCNGDPNASCDPTFETGTGAAYNTTITTSNGSYTFSDWRDVLRVLLAGFDHDHTGTDAAAWASRDCNSPVRQALASSWGDLFQNNCSSPAGDILGACTALRHVFRPGDSSDVAQTLVRLLGLPAIVAPETTVGGQLQHTGATPFCNAVRPGFVFASPPTCLQGSDASWDPTSQSTVPTCAGQAAVGANNVLAREVAVYRATFQDNDPIRRTCFGSGNGTFQAEDVCTHSGDLGLVLPINDVPEETLSPPRTGADRYNAVPCVKGHYASVTPPQVYNAISQAIVTRTRGGLLCPNGDFVNNLGGCIAPAYISGSAQCLGSKLTAPALTIGTTPVPAVHPVGPGISEGRAYNQHLYVQVGGAGAYQTDLAGFPVTGAYYRIHTFHSMVPTPDAGTTSTCQLGNANDQIGCLVAASPCSLGAAESATLTTNGATTDGLKLAAQSPLPACIAGGEYPAPFGCRTTCPPFETCGTAPDLCGGTLDCGSCPAGQVCTAQNQCCQNQQCCQPPLVCPGGQECGMAPDGCGGIMNCGTCAAGFVCSSFNTCCGPRTACPAGQTCGTVADFCGGVLNCGTCAAGQECLSNNTCCQPATSCAGRCDNLADGCGGTLLCPQCPAGQACTSQNVCCQLPTCPAGACGIISNSCGATQCPGSCPASQFCGPDNACHDGSMACLAASSTTSTCLSAQGAGAGACLNCAQVNGCLAPAQQGGTCEDVSGTLTHFAGTLPDGNTCAGVFSQGTGQSETAICLETLSTIFTSRCAASLQVTPCLCGTTDQTQCLAGTAQPNGAAYDDYSCDFNSTSSNTIQTEFTNQTFGAGQANAIVECLTAFNCPCF